MKYPRKINIALVFAVLASIFGGYYSFVSDVARLMPFVNASSETVQIIFRLGLSILVSAIIFIVVFMFPLLKRMVVRAFGFSQVTSRWFPASVEERIHISREIFHNLILNGHEIYLATVSGEWDVARPFTKKELNKLFEENKCSAKILLSHPDSAGLKKRVEKEKNQGLDIMREKIIRNTQYLMNIEAGNIEVRWYRTPPILHIIANDKEMYFSPFVDGIPGHDTIRYAVSSDDAWYQTLMNWFDTAWIEAADAEDELKSLALDPKKTDK